MIMRVASVITLVFYLALFGLFNYFKNERAQSEPSNIECNALY